MPNVKEMDCLMCHFEGYSNLMSSVMAYSGAHNATPSFGAGFMNMFTQAYDFNSGLLTKGCQRHRLADPCILLQDESRPPNPELPQLPHAVGAQRPAGHDPRLPLQRTDGLHRQLHPVVHRACHAGLRLQRTVLATPGTGPRPLRHLPDRVHDPDRPRRLPHRFTSTSDSRPAGRPPWG